MRNIDVIIKSLDYIEENLKEPISVLGISTKFGYSLYHFIRLFHGIVGHTPKDYIQRRRLTEASKEILNADRKIIDIALEYQFCSHENFSRAFRKMIGMSPMELRKKESDAWIAKLNRVYRENINQYDICKAYEVSIVELDEIELIGMSTFIGENAETITEMWDKFHNILQVHSNINAFKEYYQLQYWSREYDLNGFFVMVATSKSKIESDDITLTTKTIPAAKYLKFTHKGLSRDVYLTYKYIYQTYLPKFNYKLSIPYAFELYGNKYYGPNKPNSESEIYIPIG